MDNVINYVGGAPIHLLRRRTLMCPHGDPIMIGSWRSLSCKVGLHGLQGIGEQVEYGKTVQHGTGRHEGWGDDGIDEGESEKQVEDIPEEIESDAQRVQQVREDTTRALEEITEELPVNDKAIAPSYSEKRIPQFVPNFITNNQSQRNINLLLRGSGHNTGSFDGRDLKFEHEISLGNPFYYL